MLDFNLGRRKGVNESSYVETPVGLFTAAGNWFHTTEKQLKSYAPDLFKKYSVDRLIEIAEIWIRSSDNLTLVIFMLLLFLTNIWTALVLSLIFLPFWHLNKSAFVGPGVSRVLKLFDVEFVTFLIAVGVLSMKGIDGNYLELILGMVFFLVFKFGMYRRVINKLFVTDDPKKVTLNDRLLRMIIVKFAMAEGVEIGEIQHMEKEAIRMVEKKKQSFKSKFDK